MSKIGNVEGMIADERHGPYDFTIDGKCSECGECCSNFLPIASSEIKVIKRYIKKHKIKEQTRCQPVAGPTLDMTCPFRSEVEKGCLIYQVRPEICRVFMCNQSKEEIRRNKTVLNRKYMVIDMRSEFFGHENNVMKLLNGMLNDVLREE